MVEEKVFIHSASKKYGSESNFLQVVTTIIPNFNKIDNRELIKIWKKVNYDIAMPNNFAQNISMVTRLLDFFQMDCQNNRLNFINNILWECLLVGKKPRRHFKIIEKAISNGSAISEEDYLSKTHLPQLLDSYIKSKETEFDNFEHYQQKMFELYGISIAEYYEYLGNCPIYDSKSDLDSDCTAFNSNSYALQNDTINDWSAISQGIKDGNYLPRMHHVSIRTQRPLLYCLKQHSICVEINGFMRKESMLDYINSVWANYFNNNKVGEWETTNSYKNFCNLLDECDSELFDSAYSDSLEGKRISLENSNLLSSAPVKKSSSNMLAKMLVLYYLMEENGYATLNEAVKYYNYFVLTYIYSNVSKSSDINEIPLESLWSRVNLQARPYLVNDNKLQSQINNLLKSTKELLNL